MLRITGLVFVLTASLLAGTSQTIAFHAIPNQLYGGPPFQLSAQATSGLPVSFASGTAAVCTVSGGMVMLLATGTCAITATQPGNATFSAAPSVRQTFTVSQAHISGALTPSASSPISAAPHEYAVAVADFNLDGIPDLVTASGGDNTVTVMLGDGKGGFSAAAGSPVSTAFGQLGMVVCDFNGDGIPDLVVANWASGVAGVLILLGNGQGGFAPGIPIPLPAGTGAIAVAAGDFNGDGMPDLVLADQVNSAVTVLLGNGKGGFAATAASPISLGQSYIGPVSIVVGDFNADGFQDLAVANQTSNNVAVLLGNGSGGFSQGPSSFLRTGAQPIMIATGDFNGDGILDLATADNAGNTITVMLGNGAGGFKAASGSPYTVPSPWSLATGDINGDGSIDLVVGSASSGITALVGNGLGAFTITNGNPTVSIPISIALADFNGDGILDVANANYGTSSVSVLLGGLATGSIALAPSGTTTVSLGQAVQLTATVSVLGVPFFSPTGYVTFSDNGLLIGAATQTSSPYTYNASSLVGGSNTITANYSGDGRTSGAVSSPITVFEGGPTPTVTTLSPAQWSPGGAAFTLTVNGTGFVASSVVMWNGTSLTTKFVSATQLTASVTAALIAVGVNATVLVAVPWSNSNPVQYGAILPTVTTLSPVAWAVGGPDFTLTVNGTGFVNSSQVLWNITPLVTKFVSATQLTAQVPAATISAATAVSLTVQNSPGAVSNAVSYANSLPTVTGVSPATYLVGSTGFTLTVNGTGFVPNSQVLWNSSPLVTKFVSASQVTAAVGASNVASAGTANVAVSNGLGAVSGTLPLTGVLPTVTTLLPAAGWLVGGAGFTLTVNGAGFFSGSQVQWNGTSLVTKFVSATQLTAAVTAATIASPGAASITVSNGPGAVSNAVQYSDILPTVTTLAPAAGWLVGGADFTLTVNGTGFTSGSQVLWNSSALVTKYISATQLTADVTPATTASAGTVNISVSNGPGAVSNTLPYAAILPAITTLAPAAGWLVGGADFTLTVNGTGFTAASQVLWNSTVLVTKFVSATQLTADVPPATTATPGVVSITVSNGAGAVSNGAAYADILPALNNLSPTTWLIGGPTFTLTLNGTGFVSSSQVLWNGNALTTKYVSPSQLTASVPAATIASAGSASIAVINAVGAVSNALSYGPAAPTLSALNPTMALVGTPDFKLCVTGTNFDSASQVQFNGTGLTTAFVSTTSLCATVPGPMINAQGSALVTVMNPDGTSTGKISFTINNPVPGVPSGAVVPIYSSTSVIQPGSWVSIFGGGLANGEYVWNNDFPTSLGGTSVTINGKSAYLWAVTPGQINLQAPDDTATGQVKVVITTPFGPVNTNVTLAPAAPSISLWPTTHCPAAVILTPDGSGAYGGGGYDLLAPAGTLNNFTTRPVRAGETLLLYGVGFGPTNPEIPSGIAFSGSAPSVTLPTVTIGGTKAQVLFAGIVSAGLYQITIVVPKVPSGSQMLVAKVGTSQTQTNVSIPVQ